MQKIKLKLLFLIALTIFLSAGAAFAQQAVSPEKKALIQEFLEVSGGKKNANKIIEVMLTFQEKEMPKTVASMIDNDEKLTPARKKELKQMTSESAERINGQFREFFTKRVDMGQIMEEVLLVIYDKNFTANELRDLVAFYRTPTGQKLIDLTPALALDSMQAFNEKFAPKLDEFMRETARTELNVLKQKPASNPKPKKTARKS